MGHRTDELPRGAGALRCRRPCGRFAGARLGQLQDELRPVAIGIGRTDAWILVLDTNGVNVWCAAGKGTFGTDELIRRIEATGLPEIVSHNRVIVPQLGGPGVAAHEVRKRSGFRVVYGPVRRP